jgi:DNA mismatch endonuclease (patch repair protein)
MADKFSKKIRSKIMSRIRSQGTTPERIMLGKLDGFEYQPKAFGNPDFINWKGKIVLFVDGCFWHKCPIHYEAPRTNKKYWLPKIERNALRDREVSLAYQKSGWKVKRIWEHQIK